MLKRFIRYLCQIECPPKVDPRQGAIIMRRHMKNFTRQDLEELIIKYHMNSDKPECLGRIDWFTSYLVLEKDNERLYNIFRSEGYTNKDINRAKHVADLEEKVKRQAREIREMQLKAETFNKLLYATGYIVNCTGCEAGAPYKAEELTEEKVQTVENLAKRLRSWWNTHCCRKEREKNN